MLVRWETTPDDIHGLIQAQGVVTSHGGMTSHAAVVARGMGKPCVAGVESAKIDEAARTLTVGDTVVREGDMITIDGAAGTLMLGALPLVAAELGRGLRRHRELGRRAPPPARARQRRHAGGCAPGARARRGGHRAVPHRAHVHGRRAPAGRARDDPRDRRTRGARRRSRSCCRCSSPTSRRSSPPWRACPSPCACSIRRCTSSCPTARRWPSSWRWPSPARSATASSGSPSASAAALGAEPDARHARLPPGAPASRASTRCRCARSCAARSPPPRAARPPRSRS